MYFNRSKTLIATSATLLALAFMFEIPSGASASEGKSLGPAYQCAHDFRGEFIVKNDREIIIKGMNYDGKGPAAWFHGQLKGSKGVYTSDPEMYMTLPYPGSTCDRLQVGRVYKDEDVTLILPISITKFETIGILCYQYCHNFGHIVIPENLTVPDAPIDLPITPVCEKPNYKACSLSSTRNGDIKPDCKAGAAQMIPSALTLIIGAILAFTVFK